MKKILALCFILFSVSAFADPFEQIVFLGDSLTDNGNLYKMTMNVIPKSPPYFQGRFSNGHNWAENIAKYYYDKYYTDSGNYAYGGATASSTSSSSDSFVMPMTLQGEVYLYSSKAPAADKSKVLYVMWIGANDYLYERQADVNILSTSVVNSIVWAIDFLALQKANKFLILNLPDLSKTPYAKEYNIVDRLRVVSAMHNKKLNDAIQRLRVKYPNSKFVTVSIDQIFDDILTHIDLYNKQYGKSVKNVKDTCWTGGYMLTGPKMTQESVKNEMNEAYLTGKTNGVKNFDTDKLSNYVVHSPELSRTYQLTQTFEAGGITPCSKPNEYVFWDDLHPSAAVHEILSAISLKQLAIAGLG